MKTIEISVLTRKDETGEIQNEYDGVHLLKDKIVAISETTPRLNGDPESFMVHLSATLATLEEESKLIEVVGDYRAFLKALEVS